MEALKSSLNLEVILSCKSLEKEIRERSSSFPVVETAEFLSVSGH